MNKNINTTHDYFRRRLCALLEDLPDNREDLAEYMCVPVKTVRDWENGNKIPNVYQFREIANYFDLPYDYFLDGTDAMPNIEDVARRLGLSESTVEELMKLSNTAQSSIMDSADNLIFLVVTTAKDADRRMRGGKK